MKRNCRRLIFFVVFLVFSSTTSARLLQPPINEVGEMAKILEPPFGNGFTAEDEISYLMGLERCEKGDEEEDCVRRRMIAEAHLDYIYTQKNNGP
ncbi:hypothetical protein Nepgr_011802 [Nepenthes gracilis]|uniref:Phytosulfokine n=1 Tax=Nepenthes gracilis TaxID=150966 RepID=A0AAD3XMP5_NEPGR|nr:hypothetical protein Nepgr_011802 [Nepenthes gracilis]